MPDHHAPGPLVLVAEDNAMIAFALEDDLASQGYRVAGPFASCADALKWLASGTPDLAMIDLTLRDGPCTDLARALTVRGVPFLVVSGGARTSAPAEFRHARWLDKPVSSRALSRELGALLPVRESQGL